MSDKVVCCRCQKSYYDYTMLEVDALESDVKTTIQTKCESAGDRIIVCVRCTTPAELKEGNFVWLDVQTNL